jgi:serine phosphatase RsbU (regulator of sigma subunit)
LEFLVVDIVFVNLFLNLLYCSSAGHEPGYIYRAEKEEFEEISVRGRVLGYIQAHDQLNYNTINGSFLHINHKTL